MTEQDAKRLQEAYQSKLSIQFFMDMNANPVTFLTRELRYTFQLAGYRNEYSIRKGIFKEQNGLSAISGEAMALTGREAIATGKPQSALDHIWTCNEAALAVWNGNMNYETAARKLWARENIRSITKEENDKR
jgi:hypothetical protein